MLAVFLVNFILSPFILRPPAVQSETILRHEVLADAHRHQEFFAEDLTRVDILDSVHADSSVTVANLDALGAAAVPHETDAPLVIDADAVLPGALPRKRFKSVRWRDAQVVQAPSGVEHPQLASRHFLNLIWQFLGKAPLPDGFCRGVVEGGDHGADIIVQR